MNICSYVYFKCPSFSAFAGKKRGKKMTKENVPSFLHLTTAQARELAKRMPEEETLYELADLYKMFADSTRVRILSALCVQELCVLDLAALLGISQSALSHQLRILKQAKLIKCRREGKIICYSLADEHVESIFRQGLDHIQE